MNFKETGRSGGLYIILTKERGFGLQRMRNHGEGERKYMGELMGDQGYFISILVKSAFANSFVLLLQCWVMSVLHPNIGKASSRREILSCFEIEKAGRRQWQPTPVLLPGKSHGHRSLVGCCLWGRIESDRTERLHFHFSFFIHWRRKWQPTPVFLPGESQGRGSLVGCRLWGRTESDTTDAT